MNVVTPQYPIQDALRQNGVTLISTLMLRAEVVTELYWLEIRRGRTSIHWCWCVGYRRQVVWPGYVHAWTRSCAASLVRNATFSEVVNGKPTGVGGCCYVCRAGQLVSPGSPWGFLAVCEGKTSSVVSVDSEIRDRSVLPREKGELRFIQSELEVGRWSLIIVSMAESLYGKLIIGT